MQMNHLYSYALSAYFSEYSICLISSEFLGIVRRGQDSLEMICATTPRKETRPRIQNPNRQKSSPRGEPRAFKNKNPRWRNLHVP